MANKLIEAPNVSVTYQPANLVINGYDELNKAISDYADQFKDLVITGETEADVKKIRSQLNGVRTSINQKRKDVKQEFNKPLRDFEADIRNINSNLDDVINPIDEALRELKEQHQQDKKSEVESLIAEMAPNYGVEPSQVEINPKWLNKSTSKSSITRDLSDDLTFLAKEQKSKQAAVMAVTQYAEAKHVEPSGWVNQIENGQDLDYVVKAIDRSIEQQHVKDVATKANQIKVGDKVVDQNTGEVVDQTLLLKVKVSPSQWMVLQAVLNANNIEYSKVVQ
ncbi:DUF1351 domain-containing protein [Lentilactobacillus senioris]|uniref:DUF1351 domain-containing protein n=1 Tax=Lentilactobacillus senioris TaxID=931534 RepID=UPI003D28358D